jgi:uncharacterized membrane protein YphA (DoxX/SURF4 family)
MGRSECGSSTFLRAAIAFLWLATGLGVLHPYYRAVGLHYLGRLGLPAWPMYAACVAEVAVGLPLLVGPPARRLTALQLAAVASFTAVLAGVEPALLVDPFGVLSKNVALAAFIVAVDLVGREGWTPRVRLAGGGNAAFVPPSPPPAPLVLPAPGNGPP